MFRCFPSYAVNNVTIVWKKYFFDILLFFILMKILYVSDSVWNIRVKFSLIQYLLSSIFRYRSRENANLEYIKNIVLRYMTSDSISVKEQLSKAIGIVLQFSPAEVSVLLYSNCEAP